MQAVAPVVPNADGTAAVLRVIPTTSPQDERTSDLVHHLRHDVIPEATAGTGAEVYVGGQTATFIDMSDKVADRLPWFVGAVILLSVILLMMVFRSVAVPLKAAAMNLLSIGAAYGVIVAVFQWGWLKGLVGVEETVPIVSFMPMMLFAILFGLSMDYEVFLLTRVREEYLHRRDNTAAVIEGISATARVITSAALIMISVFAAFVLGDDPLDQDVRPRPRHRRVHRRHRGAHRARAGDHAPARRLELVAARLARPAAAQPRRRGRRGPARARVRAGPRPRHRPGCHTRARPDVVRSRGRRPGTLPRSPAAAPEVIVVHRISPSGSVAGATEPDGEIASAGRQAGTAPGRPSSTTKLANVSIGAPGAPTRST